VCSVFGAIVSEYAETAQDLHVVWNRSVERGRDSCGLAVCGTDGAVESWRAIGDKVPVILSDPGVWIGNRRAEPTTEWVESKELSDVQPFETPGGWVIAHNGTIANDKEIVESCRNELGFFEPRTKIDTEAFGVLLDVEMQKHGADLDAFEAAVMQVKGSYAFVVAHQDLPSTIFYATNYKPLWVQSLDLGQAVVVTSQKSYLLDNGIFDTAPTVIEPYTYGHIDLLDGVVKAGSLYPTDVKERTLVVCSGGLDSTVAASYCLANGQDVTLLHFLYGAKAQSKEVDSVKALAAHLDVQVNFLSTNFFKESATSSLTDDNQDIVTGFGGAEGAEYGHEWVPARNTVLIALTVAYAEAHGFTKIVLGNNLEESGGGYPDNEQEFINRWRDLIPYAVKPHTKIEFDQPLGTLMKHEIVKLGLEVSAPMELSWSCYNGGDTHCGSCGPCFMRKTAFEMNGLVDPVMPASS
jgi:7-cyano-7-deazaguanine synthase